MSIILHVDPATLRLPPSRIGGADPHKLARQIQQYGDRAAGMPIVQVTRGLGGEMMVNDGVTRATRLAKLNPRATIPVEIIEERPMMSLDHLPRIRERL